MVTEALTMSLTSKREYLAKIHDRYQRAGRRHKSRILDEFCLNCGYHRKAALRLLNRPLRSGPPKHSGPKIIYDPAELLPVLKPVWLASDQLCSKLLKLALPEWLAHHERRTAPRPEAFKEKLLAISPAQLDRLLQPVRVRYPRKGLSAIHYKEKRAIKLEEHQKILAAEVNPERKALYQLCWHLGASQGDIASLKGEDVDWQNNTVSFVRKKTGVPVLVHLGGEALNLFKDLPGEGPLFPYLSRVLAGDRATEFKSRCRQLGIVGVTLHSYRYAWAERAKTCGMPERFAQEALGHNSKAVHCAYAKRALMKIPSLQEYEENLPKKLHA
jgi:integrase